MVKIIDGKRYETLCLLGHGKGGYSYLAKGEEGEVVLKQIHHEPCSYYAFGNKIEAEASDYQKLIAAGIRVPKMLAIDKKQEIILKEYLPGKTIFQRVAEEEDISYLIPQVEEMAERAQKAGLNIDYFPTNFIEKDGLLYYIDYECNPYSEEWSFPGWGLKYWSKTKEFEEHLRKQLEQRKE